MASKIRLSWTNGGVTQELELQVQAGKAIGFDASGKPSVIDLPALAFAPLAADPGTPTAGQTWFNTVDKIFRGFNGDAMVEFAAAPPA